MSLEDALKSWSKSAAGQKKLKIAYNNAIKKGTNREARAANKHTADYYLDRFIDILRECMDRAGDKNSGYGYSYMASDECIDRTDADYLPLMDKTEIGFSFSPEKIARESLDPDYPRNVYDIVALLNHGYNANGKVYGYWAPAGRTVASLQSREGSYFIQEAVEVFNSTYGDVARAYYNEKYDG